MADEILWYDLIPFYKSQHGKQMFVTAALHHCIATGALLDSSGGPGFSLSKDFVDRINMMKYGATPKRLVELNHIIELCDKIEAIKDIDLVKNNKDLQTFIEDLYQNIVKLK